MALRELVLELGIDLDAEDAEKVVESIRKGLKRMAKGDEVKKAEKGLKGLVKRMTSLKSIALTAGGAFLTGKLAQGMGSIVETAGDAAEITNKFGAVFQESTKAMEGSADELSSRIGQSRYQVQQMYADVGALVKPLAGSSEAAESMAKGVTELSYDIASFENVLPQEAMMAFRSALIGSSEPMLRFGIDTRMLALEQYALQKGLGKSVKSMSQAELTALRFELVQKRLGEKGAIGDATKTAGSFANRLKALHGAMYDLKVTIGAELLPVATEFLGNMIELTRNAGPGLAKAFRVLGRIMVGFVRVIKGVIGAFTSLQGILTIIASLVIGLGIGYAVLGKAALVAGYTAAKGWIIATAPLLATIALLAILAAAIVLVIDDLVTMGEGGESVTGTMIQGISDLIDETGGIASAFAEMLATAFKYWISFFWDSSEEMNLWVGSLTETLNSFWSNVIDFWKGVFLSFIGWVGDQFKSLFSVVEKIPGFSKIKDFFAGEGVEQTINVARRAGAPGAGMIPPMIAAPSAVGGSSFTNQPNTVINQTINATTTGTPDQLASTGARKIEESMSNVNRRNKDAFAVAVAR